MTKQIFNKRQINRQEEQTDKINTRLGKINGQRNRRANTIIINLRKYITVLKQGIRMFLFYVVVVY